MEQRLHRNAGRSGGLNRFTVLRIPRLFNLPPAPYECGPNHHLHHLLGLGLAGPVFLLIPAQARGGQGMRKPQRSSASPRKAASFHGWGIAIR